MRRRFHITNAGRTEPCSATVRACPLGEANHYDSLQEAVTASLAPGTSSAREELNAKTAPYDLRRFFVTEEDDDGHETTWFSSRSAYHSLIGAELGNDYAQAIRDFPRGVALRESLKRLADADFENDEDWRASEERQTMASEVPALLARLEDQAEEAAIYKLLHG